MLCELTEMIGDFHENGVDGLAKFTANRSAVHLCFLTEHTPNTL